MRASKEGQRSRTIAAMVVFAALTVALNLSPAKVPAPYAPFLIYQIWEVPIVAAFLLYGLRVGAVVAIINTMVLLAIFPGVLPTGPFYNLAAILGMLLGIWIAHKIMAWVSSVQRKDMRAALSTALGAVTRVIVMTVVNFFCLPQPPPIGFGIPTAAVTAMLPVIGFFNGTLALYTIPLGYLIEKVLISGMKLRVLGAAPKEPKNEG